MSMRTNSNRLFILSVMIRPPSRTDLAKGLLRRSRQGPTIPDRWNLGHTLLKAVSKRFIRSVAPATIFVESCNGPTPY